MTEPKLPNNIDTKLVNAMREDNGQAPVQPMAESEPVTEAVTELVTEEPAQPLTEKEEEPATTDAAADEPIEPLKASDKKSDKQIDDYGNPIEPPKTYTEEEVQRMIRDRLSRGRNAEQPTTQQINKTADNFTVDPNSDEPWEVQLEKFIDHTIDKRETKKQQQDWQAQEIQKQVEFETKFNSGMNRYKDFHTVVSGKPITDAMMLATRGFEDPAAFLYAAAKMQPQELERIARMNDPYAQATEMGRLEMKMKRVKNAAINQSKIVNAPKADVGANVPVKTNIDARIAEHAKSKRIR